MFVWLVLSSVAVLCACAFVWLQGRRARNMLGHLPHYPALPIIGNAHQVLGDGVHFFKILTNITKIMLETDKPFSAWVGPQPVILLKDLDDIRTVHNAFVEKPYYYQFAEPWLGNGLVTAPGIIWKKNIKKLAGTFTANIIDGYQDVFNAQATRLVKNMKSEGSEPFDALEKYLAYTTLESICQTGLGIPGITEGNIVTPEYYKAFCGLLESFIARAKNLLYHLDFLYRLSASYKEMESLVAVLNNVSQAIITTRKKERETNKNTAQLAEETENGKTNFKAFIDILFDLNKDGQMLTEKEIKDEVNTIIVGGQETTALTTMMALHVIGSRADIQEKLVAELKSIFGESKRPVEKDDLKRMVYLEAVICEVLRLYPPIPCVGRSADRDLQIKSCTIPKGTFCMTNIWAGGRSKKQWGPDADQIRPERWIENEFANANALLAFSLGKRACIGRRYAMSLLKTLLSNIVREFVIESDIEKLQFKVDVSLSPCSGNLIRVKERN